MSTRKLKQKSLSEKVSETFIRPLADSENDSEDDSAPKLAVLDSDDDYNTDKNVPASAIRKQNAKLLSDFSEKYRGKISTRKEIEGNFEESESDEQSSDEETNQIEQGDEIDLEDDHGKMDNDLERYRKKLKNCQLEDRNNVESSDSGQEDGSDEERDSSESTDEDSDYDTSGDISEQNDEDNQEPGPSTSGLLKKSNRNSDIQKGLAVQNQLNVWEKLLEIRIHSQKMLFKANSLPLPEQFSNLSNNEEFRAAAKETTENVSTLVDKMLELESKLADQYSEMKGILNTPARQMKRSHSKDKEDESGGKRFAQILQSNFDNFRPYRNSVLQKWHDRTKILTPGAGNKVKSSVENFDVVKKVEHVLLNRNDLIKKSQTVKGNYELFSKDLKTNTEFKDEIETNPENESSSMENSFCPEIYDDTDFYHQQLRELIEFKTNSSTNPIEMSKQFAELQKMRHKMKKKVDTRASKGRKIRYVVHNKLVNFMAPNQQSEWTEESKNELYRSLFAT